MELPRCGVSRRLVDVYPPAIILCEKTVLGNKYSSSRPLFDMSTLTNHCLRASSSLVMGGNADVTDEVGIISNPGELMGGMCMLPFRCAAAALR